MNEPRDSTLPDLELPASLKRRMRHFEVTLCSKSDDALCGHDRIERGEHRLKCRFGFKHFTSPIDPTIHPTVRDIRDHQLGRFGKLRAQGALIAGISDEAPHVRRLLDNPAAQRVSAFDGLSMRRIRVGPKESMQSILPRVCALAGQQREVRTCERNGGGINVRGDNRSNIISVQKSYARHQISRAAARVVHYASAARDGAGQQRPGLFEHLSRQTNRESALARRAPQHETASEVGVRFVLGRESVFHCSTCGTGPFLTSGKTVSTVDIAPIRFFARSLHGIEWIVAAEVEEVTGARILCTGHREIHFEAGAPSAEALSRLRTADDLFLEVGEARQIDRHRASLERLVRASSQMPWTNALTTLRNLRRSAPWTSFSVTASFLGKRNYNRYEIEEHAAKSIRHATGLTYRPSLEPSGDRRELGVRVHITEERAMFSLRVFDEPLHRRPYKQRSHPGTLHPPLAAAMALLSGLRPGLRVLDPFCGVGTIGIESARLDPSIRFTGADIDASKLADARANATNAKARVALLASDAGRLPIAPHRVNRIITNPPWRIAVDAVGAFAAAPPATRFAEIDRVLSSDGRAVLLIHGDDASTFDRWGPTGLVVRFRKQVSIFGQHPWLYLVTRDTNGPSAAVIDQEGLLGTALQRNLGRVSGDDRDLIPSDFDTPRQVAASLADHRLAETVISETG
jgi:tRNA (guanine6-N2)-methyltransferase